MTAIIHLILKSILLKASGERSAPVQRQGVRGDGGTLARVRDLYGAEVAKVCAIKEYRYTTGCPKVTVMFESYCILMISEVILKPFGMVNATTGRFGLMHSSYFYRAKSLGKYGICLEQNSE